MSEIPAPQLVKPVALLHVTIEQLQQNGHNPRRSLGDLTGLIESIRTSGLNTPLLVEQMPDNVYNVIEGHRRLAALTALKWSELIPVVVIKRAEDASPELVMMNLNCLREDIPILERAVALKRITKTAEARATIASMLGMTSAELRNEVRLLDLPKDIQKGITEGTVGKTMARWLASLDEKIRKEVLKQADEDLSDNALPELIMFVKNVLSQNLSHAIWNVTDEKLHGGACTMCPKLIGGEDTLFGMKKEEARCGDRTCFHKKALILATQKYQTVLKAAGKDMENVKHLAIRSGGKIEKAGYSINAFVEEVVGKLPYATFKKLMPWEWQKVNETTKSKVLAVVTDGEEFAIKEVATSWAQNHQKSKEETLSPAEKKEKERQTEARKKQQHATLITLASFEKLLEKANRNMAGEQFLSYYFEKDAYTRVDLSACIRIAKWLGLEYDHKSPHSAEDAIYKKFPRAWARFALEKYGHTTLPNPDGTINPQLRNYLKVYGLAMTTETELKTILEARKQVRKPKPKKKS